MRAVILETQGGLAAALADDGCVYNIPNSCYSIGQQIEMRSVAIADSRAALRGLQDTCAMRLQKLLSRQTMP